MKKELRTGFVLLIFIGISYSIWFVFSNFRGAAPAFGPAGEVIERPVNTSAGSANTTGLPLSIPSGISISTFVKGLGGPRVLALDPTGTLLASIPSPGRIVALKDNNGDGTSDETLTVVDGLSSPHGLVFRDGKLYIAETNQVAVYDYDTDTKRASSKKKLFDLPGGGNHFSRTIGFGPDGKLYVSVGSSCNVCNEKDWRRAKILVANADGSNVREYATGLRNSVFFIWHPKTGDMWATEMGRDLLGDNIPPDEVNIITEGEWYGWPTCYGKQIADRDYIRTYNENHISPEAICSNMTIPSYIDIPAHSAPLGLAVIPDNWPKEYRGDLLVSYHGSWNRTEPTGYKVVRFNLDNNFFSTGESDFITGFLQGNSAVGRPVDLFFDPKGTLYISDDKAGVIYRVAVL